MSCTNLHFYTFFAAPSPPRQIRVQSLVATRVVLTWKAPLYVNGSHLTYYINCTSSSSTIVTSKTSTQKTITLGDLTPYTKYNVIIQAATYVQINNRSSNWLRSKKAKILFTTLQASKMLYKASCDVILSSNLD